MKGLVVGLALISALGCGSAGAEARQKTSAKPRASECKRIVFEGEVRAGERFAHEIDQALSLVLEPIASGWVIRVRPTNGESLRHDYAELATPPYVSVNPLLISTDYSFRAQDVVGWNPRRFAYAPDRESFLRLQAAYDRYMAGGKGAHGGEVELSGLVMRARQGEFAILDAHLVPGLADQWRMAAGLATHFTTTAHSIDSAGGMQTPLGKVTWLRFRVTLDGSVCR